MGRIRAVVLVAALLAGLTGCSLWPEPPEELVAAAEIYAAEVRALPGVKTAEVTVDSLDPKDHPNDWVVSIGVETFTADDLSTVPAAVAAVRPPSGATSHVSVHIPAGPGLARVVVTDALPADIERAERLRVLPVAEAVVLLYGGFTVYLLDDAPLTDAVAGVRASGTLTPEPLDSVQVGYAGGRVAVDVSTAGPSDALIALIEQLDDDPAVQNVYATEPSEQDPRPGIDVRSDDPSRMADTLAGFTEEDVAARPRTSFSSSGADLYIRGFVGLPLGSAEPDDLPPPPPAQPPTDPAVLAAQLAEDTLAITDFLAATVASSGIPGTPEVFESECPGGPQVQGTLLLKVFEYEPSAYRAYDAIVAGWEAQGYAHTDQAMGTSIYTGGREVAQLTIRGTVEGIEVAALGECRG